MGGEHREPGIPGEDDQYGFLKSVTLAARVLSAFSTSPELGPTQVAHRLGVAKSSAHRVLATLASEGLLEHTASGRYRLSLLVIELGQIAANRFELRRHALPILTRLRNEANETFQLCLPAGSEVHYVERVEALPGLRFTSDIYRRGPAHLSSGGKVLVAFNPESAKACLESGLEPATGYTLSTKDQFIRALAEIRRQGWVCSVEEHELGMASIGVPVFGKRPPGADGRSLPPAIAALDVAGPMKRIVSRQDYLLKLLQDAAAELQRAVDGRRAVGDGRP